MFLMRFLIGGGSKAKSGDAWCCFWCWCLGSWWWRSADGVEELQLLWYIIHQKLLWYIIHQQLLALWRCSRLRERRRSQRFPRRPGGEIERGVSLAVYLLYSQQQQCNAVCSQQQQQCNAAQVGGGWQVDDGWMASPLTRYPALHCIEENQNCRFNRSVFSLHFVALHSKPM